MNVERVGNLIEATLWFAVCVVFVFKAIQGCGRLRAVFMLLAAAFFVFGVTDLIESETGAWWRPLWLLALKSSCVTGFVFGFAAYYRLARPRKNKFEELVRI